MSEARSRPRPPILKRGVSLLAFVILCGALWIGYRSLPGAGGLESELRWLLATPDAPTKRLNQAITLVATVHQTRPDAARAAYRNQYLSAQPASRAQLLYISSFLFGVDSRFADAFFDWFRRSPKPEHVAYAEELSRCYATAIARSSTPEMLFYALSERDAAWLTVAIAKEPLAVRHTDVFLLARAVGDWRPTEQPVESWFNFQTEEMPRASLTDVFPSFYQWFEHTTWEAPDAEAVARALNALRADADPLVQLCALRLLAAHGDDAALATLRADGDVVVGLLADTDAERSQH